MKKRTLEEVMYLGDCVYAEEIEAGLKESIYYLDGGDYQVLTDLKTGKRTLGTFVDHSEGY
jgi:hypothetical protein